MRAILFAVAGATLLLLNVPGSVLPQPGTSPAAAQETVRTVGYTPPFAGPNALPVWPDSDVSPDTGFELDPIEIPVPHVGCE